MPPDSLPPLWWRIAIWTVSLVWLVLQIPYAYGLQPYVFFDSGWALATNDLLSEGLIPTRDFAYFYGLLTLVIDRAWFAVFGATPLAQAALCALCAIAATQAVIRFAAAGQLRRSARWLLLVAAPLAIMPSFYSTPTHALEHALLISALAAQAAGRPDRSLLLGTICMFVKPTLAGVYGPILVGIILFGPRTVPFKSRVLKLLPATFAAVAIAALLAVRFGVEPLLATLVPLDGAKLYAAENYGFFFGIGRRFWLPEKGRLDYYLFMPAAFWMVGTVILIAGAIRNRSAVVLTCAALHLVFTLFLFGNDMSWKYYPYPLIFGLCGIVDRFGAPEAKPAVVRSGILIALAAQGQAYMLLVGLAMLASAILSPNPTRTPATAGLLAGGPDQIGWQRVREISANDRVLILSPVGAGHVLMPDVDSPRSWFLLRPIVRPAELERLREQIARANWLVIPTGPGDSLVKWPELADRLAPFLVVESHSSFVLAKRVR